MLAYILALAVGLGSIAIYMAAFFFPEVHRKNDFYWSGVGFFYALVLWVCAGRITGGLLLGQIASVALLGWFAWQTLTLRRELLPVEQQTAVPSKEKLQETLSKITPPGGLGKVQEKVTGLFTTAKNQVQRTVISVTQRPKGKTDADKQKPSQPQSLKDAIATTETETVDVTPITAPEIRVAPSNAVEVQPTTPPSPFVTSDAAEVEPTTPASPVVMSDAVKVEPTTTPETPELVPPNPPPVELVEAAQEATPVDHIPVEEIAPDAVLAPPAEAPVPPEDMPSDLSDVP